MPRYNDKEYADILRNNPDLQPDRVIEYPHPTPIKLSEHEMQCLVISECERRALGNPLWSRLTAIPNGGHRNKAVAGKLKAEGVRAGMLDFIFPVARHGYHGAFIELKVGSNKPSRAQQDWIAFLKEQGYAVKVFHDDPYLVIDWLNWYLI